jgi:hypothetical protein
VLIGCDLDNTIIDYDAAFTGAGLRLGLLPAGFCGDKRDVRAYLQTQENGDWLWQHVQAAVYGRHIEDARLAEGVAACLARLRAAGLSLAIISHKTETASADPHGPNLREVALNWLRMQGFFAGSEPLMEANAVYFADSRAEKLQRIRALGCDFFIDDLAEVLSDPAFPATTRGLHFSPTGQEGGRQPRFASWSEIGEHIMTAVFGRLG